MDVKLQLCDMLQIQWSQQQNASADKVAALGIDLDLELIDRAKLKAKEFLLQRAHTQHKLDLPTTPQPSNKNVNINNVPVKEEIVKQDSSCELSFFAMNVMDLCTPLSDGTFRISDSNLVTEFLHLYGRQEFDLVVCFSITMWIHLNYDDDGLFRFLTLISQLGRFVILEPQPWSCYKNAVKRHKKLGVEAHPLFSSLNVRNDVDERICRYMVEQCGMKVVKILGETEWKRKVFLLAKKGNNNNEIPNLGT